MHISAKVRQRHWLHRPFATPQTRQRGLVAWVPAFAGMTLPGSQSQYAPASASRWRTLTPLPPDFRHQPD